MSGAGEFAPHHRSEPDEPLIQMSDDHQLARLFEDAALLQEKVPNAVLVGGSVSALYAGHRLSFDHDHVVQDLRERFNVVLEALEADPEYVVNRITPGKIVLGEHGDIEYGIRQLIRNVPLEVTEVELWNNKRVRVPTLEEAIRIKAYLVVKRNQVRDYLDVAALAKLTGIPATATVLNTIDLYYTDPDQDSHAVATQLATMLSDPRPTDSTVTKKLEAYKSLTRQWQDWDVVRAILSEVALHME